MLDRLRCRYGRYVCTVRKGSPELSSGSLNGSHQGRGIWEVSIEEELGISMSMGLLSTLTQSPKSDFIDVKYEGEVETQETPKVSRGRAVEPKSPAPEVITVHHIYEFPSIEALALATEAELRALGMGYRAKFISGSAQFLASKVEGGNIWLQGLRDMSAAEELVPDSIVSVCIKDEKKGRAVVIKAESAAKSKLLQVGQVQLARRKKAYETLGSNRLYVQSQLMLMPGVGRKVADCVALFSLDQVESIPVDTHVWDIALRDYDPSLSLKGAKSITPVVYEEVGEVFRSRFPIKAGWAHSVLFAAELPEFRQRLPLYMQTEMKAFTEQMKSAKSVESNIKLEKRREKEEASDMDKITPLTSRKRKTAATTSNPTTPETMSVRRTTKPAKSER